MPSGKFAPTLENLERSLFELATLIERYPRKECLWLYVDRLKAERGKVLSRKQWLEEVRGRIDQSFGCSDAS